MRSKSGVPGYCCFIGLVAFWMLLGDCFLGDAADFDRMHCKKLDTGFSYTQENAPKDINAILALVTNKINREITYVSKVEVEYDGHDIHSVVGDHDIIANVKRIDEDDIIQNLCFNITFSIADTNECLLKQGHPMAAKCHHSSQCENTVGSYECACQDGAVAIAGSGMGLCGGAQNTSCCAVDGVRSGRGAVAACKADFRCPENRCPGDCVVNAECINVEDDASYTCKCPDGEVGTGHACDGDQPIAWRIPHGNLIPGANAICGCQVPQVDYCAHMHCGDNAYCVNQLDHAECRCKPGFKLLESVGCVDERVPSMKLLGKNPLRLRQCDTYDEAGVAVTDENDAGLTRNVIIDYSQPLGACLREMGSYHVNYTLETPWTTPDRVTLTRWVEVQDIDECALGEEAPCPLCVPRCAPEAACSNTIGSYTCACPSCMKGDGFLAGKYRPGTAPYGYHGGTGCVDSCPPQIHLAGDNPFVFEVPKIHGLGGPDDELAGCKPDWAAELRRTLERTGGRALCRAPKGGVCATARDDTGQGTVDLTERIRVGAPEALPGGGPGEHRFRVPYDVKDAAGNRAVTAHREVVVRERALAEAPPPRPPPRQPAPDCPKPDCPPCAACPACPRAGAAACPACPEPPPAPVCEAGGGGPPRAAAPAAAAPAGWEAGFREDLARIFLQLVIVAVALLTVVFLGQVVYAKVTEPAAGYGGAGGPAAGTPSQYRPVGGGGGGGGGAAGTPTPGRPSSAFGSYTAGRSPAAPAASPYGGSPPPPGGLSMSRDYSVLSSSGY